MDRQTLGCVAASLAGHAIVLGAALLVPATAATLSLQVVEPSNRYVQYAIEAPTSPPPGVRIASLDESPARGGRGPSRQHDPGGRGRRQRGAEGRLGAPGSGERDHTSGWRSAPEAPLSTALRVDPARSGVLAVLDGRELPSPLGPSRGLDPEAALGSLLGFGIGETWGTSGLALRGTGRSGGGDGAAAIGLGQIDDVGRGGGGGTGCGYGLGLGGIGGYCGCMDGVGSIGFGSGRGYRIHAPEGARVELGGLAGRRPGALPGRGGEVEVRGGLPAEVVQRYVRRQMNEIRHCYETGLARRPDLAGRVVVAFTIGGSGAVTSSTVAASTLADAEAEACVARAIGRIAFPSPEGVVVVRYPFLFMAP